MVRPYNAVKGPAMINIDLDQNPGLQFRLDSFSVPMESRDAFLKAMHQNLAFLQTLPGFLGHVVFEKTAGPTQLNLATLAIWRDADAIEAAGAKVQEYYQQIGFDAQETLARLGITAEFGNYHAPSELQRRHHIHLARAGTLTATQGGTK